MSKYFTPSWLNEELESNKKAKNIDKDIDKDIDNKNNIEMNKNVKLKNLCINEIVNKKKKIKISTKLVCKKDKHEIDKIYKFVDNNYSKNIYGKFVETMYISSSDENDTDSDIDDFNLV